MTKLLRETLKVTANERGEPRFLYHRGRWLKVLAVLDLWNFTGSWWDRESPKTFFRLKLEGGRVWEVYRDSKSGKWRLYRVYD